MRHSRRAVLAAIATAATGAGCLRLGPEQPEPGVITAGEQTRSPVTDGSLPDTAEDWPTDQFDAGNTGFNPELSGAPASEAQVKWHRQVVKEEDALSGAPSLADGSVFVTTDERLVVLSAETGDHQWSVSLPAEGTTGPTVAGRHVFVGTERALVAVDRRERSIAWTGATTETTGMYENPVVFGTPAVSDEIGVAGTIDGVLYAFDAASGARQWSYAATTLPDESEPKDVGNTPAFRGPPAIAHGQVYVSNFNGFLYAIDATTGTEQWRMKTTDGSFRWGPTVVGDTVYAVSQVELIAADAVDGTVQWRFSDDPGSMKESATVAGETIYVASGESYGSLQITALDRRDRSIEWRVPGRPQASFSAGPDRLYVPLYGNLVAIDRDSGEIAWELETESVIGGPPVVTNGGIVAADERGSVFGIGSAE